MAVVQMCGRDGGDQKATIRVGQRVGLAAHYTPGWIVAAFPVDAHTTRACRMNIPDGPCRASLAPGSLKAVHRERMRQDARTRPTLPSAEISDARSTRVGTYAAGAAARSLYEARKGFRQAPMALAGAMDDQSRRERAASLRPQPIRHRSGRLRRVGFRAQAENERWASKSVTQGGRQTLPQRPGHPPFTRSQSSSPARQRGLTQYLVLGVLL